MIDGRKQFSLAHSTTFHCLLGCGIGEVVGVIVGTALGLSILATLVLAVILGFVLASFSDCGHYCGRDSGSAVLFGRFWSLKD